MVTFVCGSSTLFRRLHGGEERLRPFLLPSSTCSSLPCSLLVLAENLPLLYLGWEGVGFCSYALIGFWYREEENATAGRKAFIVTRIGDIRLRHRHRLDVSAASAPFPSPN